MIIGNLNNVGGRFGNKILYLNNVVQVSNYLKHDYKIIDSEIFNYFNINVNNLIPEMPHIDGEITLNDLLSDKIKTNVYDFNKNFLIESSLFEIFFKYDTVNTFDFLKLKQEFITNGKKIIALHFRGTDFFEWDKNCILDYNYYLNSLKYVLSEIDDNFEIFILTDDLSLSSLLNLKEWMVQNNIPYHFGDINNPKYDFNIMAFSDYLISSPSTFCICSGFMGNPNKKIIHSKTFIENFKLNSNYFRDCFWKILFETNGNNNYKVYKFI